MSKHQVQRMATPAGLLSSIDTARVQVARALWRLGLDAITVCADHGKHSGRASARYAQQWAGYALIELAPGDACALLNLVGGTPEFDCRMHWADDGAWEVSVPVLPPGGFDDPAQVGPWAQVRFPGDQMDDLLAVLQRTAAARK